jgi:hypothetical protein
MLDADRSAIEAIGTSLAGPDRPLVAVFGTMALAPGRTGTEDDEVDPSAAGGPRGASERTMLDLASRGVRTSIVLLPPIVHGYSSLRTPPSSNASSKGGHGPRDGSYRGNGGGAGHATARTSRRP